MDINFIKRDSLRIITTVFLCGALGCSHICRERIDNDNQSFELLFDTFEGPIKVEKTDIIATSGNSILKIMGDELAMSNDLGKTWKYLHNRIGTISYVHWFKDQTCLICGRTSAYWTDMSFTEIHDSTIYDYDGSVLCDNAPHFFYEYHGHDDNNTIAGKEVLIWPDYFGDVEGYISRVWYTDDCGKTIRCICKNNETQTEDGGLISCRHFHDCVIREGFDEIYITSGDFDNQCKLIKGQFINGIWHYSILGEGPLYKFDAIYLSEPYLLLLCDYTGYGQTGILRVPITSANDFSNYEYIYICQENLPVLRRFNVGKYSFITFDGSVKGKVLYSYESKPYRSLPIILGEELHSISNISSPNNAGLVLLQVGNETNTADLKLNNSMYNLTNGMYEAGFENFGFVQ